MTAEILKQKTKEEINEFIRERLAFNNDISEQLRYVNTEAFKKEHKRFDMSGYETETGKCTVDNLAILNLFADLGIYDYTSYLFLDFYKGTPTLYLKYFHDEDNFEFDYSGYRTTDIIYEVFLKTILSNKPTRRRI